MESKDSNFRKTLEEICISSMRKLSDEKLNYFAQILFQVDQDNLMVNIPVAACEESFESVLNQYKNYLISENKAKNTIKDYLKSVDKFISFLKAKDKRLNDINRFLVSSYLSEINKDIGSNTYSKKVVLLISFLKFLEAKGIILGVSKDIKIPKKTEVIKSYLNDSEILLVENYLDKRKKNFPNGSENIRDKIIFYLGIECGLRRQEMINLNLEDISFKDNLLMIKKSKGNKSRIVPFPDKLKSLLVEYKKNTQYKGPLLRGIQGKRITKCALQNIASRILKDNELKREGLTLHSLRHVFADRHRRQGTRPEILMKLMGHSDLKTTLEYYHITQDEIKSALLAS